MPHQCLACGHLFAEGSSAILQGCPECRGTRFFYTANPVGDQERKVIAQKAQKDLRQVVSDMLQQAAPETAAELGRADDGKWKALRASDVRRLVRKVQAEQNRFEAGAPHAGVGAPHAKTGASRVEGISTGANPSAPTWENPDVRPLAMAPDASTVKARLEAAKDEARRPQKPDTVNVRAPGAYDIDVRGLMDKAPVVVHKDGAYLIHLPSLFDQKKAD